MCKSILKYAFFLLVIPFSSNVFCQTYSYQFRENKAEFYTASALWVGSHFYELVRSAEILDDPDDLNINGLWGFDRSAVYQNSRAANTWSDITMYASIATPILITFGDSHLRNNVGDIALIGLQGYFMTDGLTMLIKGLAERPRPYLYKQRLEVLNTPIGKSSTESFISGHTSASAYFSFYAARIYTDSHPGSPLNPWIWGSAAIVPALTGYCRYKAGKHFPTDVISGYLVGASLGAFLPSLYKSDRWNVDLAYGGFQLQWKF